MAARRSPFVLAIGLSAFLLFSLELLAGRLLLPVFGGSPQVWTTALVFFTAALLAGYAYAHLAATRVVPRTAMLAQLALVALAVGLTALAPPDPATTRLTGTPEVLNVLLALAVLAGPAALLLATTTPLMSAWYAGTGRSPWWLYAVSNGASFGALLAYPLVIQPLIGISVQRVLLVAGLVAYGVLVLWLAAAAPRRVKDEPADVTTAVTYPVSNDREPVSNELPRPRRQVVWLLAASVPAALLAATTNFVQTDLASAPLIWIGPLAAYLASFVVAFSDRGRRAVVWADRLSPAAAILLGVPFILPVGWPVLPLLAVEIGSLFVLAVAIHGRLSLDRPAERHLTRFYLILSAGGVLGTAAVAIVAPLVFSTIYEFPLLIVAALAARVVLPDPASRATTQAQPRLAGVRALTNGNAWRELAARVVPYAAVAAALVAAVAFNHPAVAPVAGGLLLFGGLLVGIGGRPPIAMLATAVFLGVMLTATATAPLYRERTFFGVLEVRADPEYHTFYSGTTIHGRQYLDDRRDQPTTYYMPNGPVGDAFADLRLRSEGGASIGVVGLGAGVLAAYSEPGDELTFIEIDPAVARVAADARYFTYLSDAPVDPVMIIGDGRLELAKLPAGSFDLLVIDAFTSDVVPAHLLTAEAMHVYLRSVRPDGVVLLNLSNRFYDLVSTTAATAGSIGVDALGHTYEPSPDEVAELSGLTSRWVVVGQRGSLARFTGAGWSQPSAGAVLTDDYSDLTRLLLAGLL